MNSFFVFDFAEKIAGSKSNRIAVIFCPKATRRLSAKDSDIRDDYFNQTIPPDKIYLIVSGSLNAEELKEVYQIQNLTAVLPSQIRSNPSLLELLTFDQNGDLYTIDPVSFEPTRIAETKASLIKKEGLQKIFCKRGGILEASTTHHYIKPSGRHCDKFVRIANVLHVSSEINYIAFCLLKYVKEDVTHIYCDTSSIHSVAYAISYLRGQFENCNNDYTINSFSSYQGFEDFDFSNAATSLVLISTSTSGELVEKVAKKKRHRLQSVRHAILSGFTV